LFGGKNQLYKIMAHFAKIESDNKVSQVIVIDSSKGAEFITVDLGISGTWIQTSYNTRAGKHLQGGTPLRKNYAGVGFTYDPERDAFIPPKRFQSWILDEETCNWIAPVSYPSDKTKKYIWDESIINWVEIVPPSA
jgi:hypothetical protein